MTFPPISAQQDDWAYIGINENGHARAICFDDPQYKADTAKLVAEWIKMGRTVERLPRQQACARLKRDWDAPLRQMRLQGSWACGR